MIGITERATTVFDRGRPAYDVAALVLGTTNFEEVGAVCAKGAAVVHDLMVTTAEWFSVDELDPSSRFARAFLTRLGVHAAAWDTDVRPGDTSHDAIVDTVWARIDVPGLSGGMTVLWVECAEDYHGVPLLQGSWGDRWLIADHYGDDPLRDLTMMGAPASPEMLADVAARWCERHLRMDVVREEWTFGRWTHWTELGRQFGARKRGTPVRRVLERTNGRATGNHLPSAVRLL